MIIYYLRVDKFINISGGGSSGGKGRHRTSSVILLI